MVKRTISKQVRFQVFHRDGYKCVICGKTPQENAKLHIDHIHPEDNGGDDSLENLRVLCADCNLGKSDLIFHPTTIPTQTIIPVPVSYIIDHTQQGLHHWYISTKNPQLNLDQLVLVINTPGTSDRVNPIFEGKITKGLVLNACMVLQEDGIIEMSGESVTILQPASLV